MPTELLLLVGRYNINAKAKVGKEELIIYLQIQKKLINKLYVRLRPSH